MNNYKIVKHGHEGVISVERAVVGLIHANDSAKALHEWNAYYRSRYGRAVEFHAQPEHPTREMEDAVRKIANRLWLERFKEFGWDDAVANWQSAEDEFYSQTVT